MKQLHFATSNKWKFDQARDYFTEKGIRLIQFNTELPESRSEEVVEVAKEKAQNAFSKLNKPVFIIDAAFYIKALNDFPKTYIKFTDKYIGAKGVLKLLENKKDRRWEFANVICYKDTTKEKIFNKLLKGVVTTYLGKNNPKKLRDIDRIFIPEGYKKPYSEFTIEEQGNYDEKVWKPTVFDKFIEWFIDKANQP